MGQHQQQQQQQQHQPNELTKLIPYQHVSIQNSISFEEDLKSDNSSSSVKSKLIGLFILPLVTTALFFTFAKHTFNSPVERIHHHDHTIPTLLSIRSDEFSQEDLQGRQGKFLDSLSNFIYDIMKEADFDEDNENDAVQYTINADKTEISFHDNLTIEWETRNSGVGDVGNGNKNGPMNIVNSDHNVIALYCPADEPDPRKFRDAATIAQIRTTNSFHGYITDLSQNGDDESQNTTRLIRKRRKMLEAETIQRQWVIPSFPIIKEDTCSFKLWIRGHNDYHADERGKQIARFTLGASTEPIMIKDGTTQPTNIHLAFTKDPSEMMVQFATGAEGTPIVAYHQDEDLVMGGNMTAGLLMNQGESTTYEAQDMCQKPAIVEEPGKFSSPGILHSVVMSTLDPNTRYYYKIGIVMNSEKENITDNLPDDNIVWSEVNTFQSPMTSETQEQFSFIVYADQGAMGYGNDDGADRTSALAEREVETNDIRSVHHIGDLSYATGVSHMWDKWLDMVQKFSSSVPLMIGVGNHEYDHTDGGENGKDPSGVKTPGGFNPSWGDFNADSNGECGVPVSKRFKMPANGNGVFWYSYAFGNVYTIMLSSEHDLSQNSVQYKWLENELKSVNRTLTPWLLVEAHRPMYNDEDIPWNTKVGIGMRKEFEPLLHKYKVDLFLSGHYHSYMRSCSGLYNSKCNNGGPIHITVGTAGAALDDVPLLNSKWDAVYIKEWGYGRVTSISNTKLKWEFVSDKDGSVKDEITITK